MSLKISVALELKTDTGESAEKILKNFRNCTISASFFHKQRCRRRQLYGMFIITFLLFFKGGVTF